MVFKLTCQHCELSDATLSRVNRNLNKITQRLPNVADDLIVVRLLLKRDTDQYFSPRTRRQHHKTYVDSKPNLAYYQGTLTLRLDKVNIIDNFKGETIEECIENGFESIFKKINKFKDKHFPSESEYRSRATIRKGAG